MKPVDHTAPLDVSIKTGYLALRRKARRLEQCDFKPKARGIVMEESSAAATMTLITINVRDDVDD